MHSLKLAVVGIPYAGSIVFSRKKKKSTHMHFHLPHTCYDLRSGFPWLLSHFVLKKIYVQAK